MKDLIQAHKKLIKTVKEQILVILIKSQQEIRLEILKEDSKFLII